MEQVKEEDESLELELKYTDVVNTEEVEQKLCNLMDVVPKNQMKNDICLLKGQPKQNNEFESEEHFSTDLSIDEQPQIGLQLELLPISKTVDQTEVCQVKEETDDIDDMESKNRLTDVCIDQKPEIGPLLQLVPSLKMRLEDVSHAHLEIPKKSIEQWSTTQNATVIKEKKSANQESSIHFSVPRRSEISKAQIRKQPIISKSLSKVCTKAIDSDIMQDNLVQNSSSSNNFFECEICGLSVCNKIEIRNHMLTHDVDNQLSCKVCNKTFSKSNNLKTHLRTHTGERPYVCHLCSKSFSIKCNLMAHIRIHTGERPFVCELCNKSFSESSSLKKHMVTHSDERRFICELCRKAFCFRSSLGKHLRIIHTGYSPHSCHFCIKSFSSNTNLVEHVRIHTGERPFVCKHCNKSYSCKRNLSRHMLTHSSKPTCILIQTLQ